MAQQAGRDACRVGMEQEKAGGGDQVLAASRVRSERVVAVKMGGREGVRNASTVLPNASKSP